MSRATDRSAAEAAIIDNPDDPVEIASIPVAAPPESRPVRLDEDTTVFSADLSAVLAPGEQIQSDSISTANDSRVDFHVESGGPGQPYVGVPDDEAATRGPVAIDRAPTDEEFQTATVRADDTATGDAERRAEFEERQRSAREREIERKLKTAESDLKLAETSAKLDDALRRRGLR